MTLPLSVTYAQSTDVRAVTERLERAVKAGEMSKADMEAVLRALKQSSGKRQDPRKKRGDARKKPGEDRRKRGDETNRGMDERVQKAIEDTNRRLRAAVEAGKMTQEEARKASRERIAAIKERAGQSQGEAERRGAGDAMEKMKAEHEALYRELIEMVKAGKLSREDMQRKVEAHRRGIGEKMRGAEKKGDKKADPSKDMVRQRLERAVESGDLTEEQAKQRYMEWEKRSGGAKAEAGSDKKSQSKRTRKSKGSSNPKGMLDQAQLRDLVERGVMTKEQAKERWERFQKEMDAKKGQQKAGEKGKKKKKKRKAPKK